MLLSIVVFTDEIHRATETPTHITGRDEDILSSIATFRYYPIEVLCKGINVVHAANQVKMYRKSLCVYAFYDSY